MVSKRKDETENEFKVRKLAVDAAYRSANREKARKVAAEWRKANLERKTLNDARWRAENPERMKEARAAWKRENKDRLRVYKQTRRARAAQSSGRLSTDIEQRLMGLQRGRCANCKSRLVERHLDHVMPLALGGRNEDENVQLLCPPCNWKKNAKHPLDFARDEGRLL